MRFRTGHILAVCVLAIAVGTGLASGPGPASAAPLAGGTAIAAGGGHTCALTVGGGVKCWGSEVSEAFPDFSLPPVSVVPVDVTGLTSGAHAIAAGEFDVCAVTASGGVKCWYYGHAPQDVPGLTTGAVAVAAESGQNSRHACALTTAGGVKCWGYNGSGELGNGTTGGPDCGGVCYTTAVNVSGLTRGVAAVTAGFSNSCALTTSGGVKCWGQNFSGQLGNGTTTNSSTPVDVTGLASGVAAVSAGVGYTCAVTTGGGAKCWGDNSGGQLGNGTTTGSTTPTDVCATGATPPCSESNGNTLTGVTGVSAGYQHACAVTTSGGVKCWGVNDAGQLGTGTRTGPQTCSVVFREFVPCSTVPEDVSGLTSDVAAVAVGVEHACALTVAGGVTCWGRNFLGQLGDGTTTDRLTPVDVIDTPIYRAGDVNCGNSVDTLDALLILQLGSRLLSSLPCLQNSDVNQDGQVNSIDALLVLQYSAGLISTLPGA